LFLQYPELLRQILEQFAKDIQWKREKEEDEKQGSCDEWCAVSATNGESGALMND